MAIYAKNITKAQREWLKLYQATTRWEPMHQDELTDGTMSFERVAKINVDWFENWMNDAHLAISSNIPEEKETAPAA
jgi:hypothetical protein